jgi:predicted permease
VHPLARIWDDESHNRTRRAGNLAQLAQLETLPDNDFSATGRSGTVLSSRRRMTNLVRDIRYGFRSLSRTPVISVIALVTIALGVGANTAMFSVVNTVLLRPLPYPAPEELVSPWPEKRWSVAMLEDVEERVGSYRDLSVYTAERFMMLGEGPAEMVAGALVTASHFDVLGARPALGAGFVPGDATGERGAVVVVSHGFWQNQLGGDPDVVGRGIRLAGVGQEDRTIVGVLPADFQPLQGLGAAQVWVPLVTTPGQPGYWGAYGLNAIGRLRPGATAAQASQELRGLVDELTPTHPTQFRPIRYSPVDVVSLHEGTIREVRPRLLVLLAAVGFILLIACTNVANLLLARAQGRRRQVAVQMALGSSRGRVIRQVLTESVVLALLGGAIGVAAAFYALPVIASFVSGHVPRGSALRIDLVVLAFATGASVLAGVLFGAIPAVRASSSEPAEVLRSSAGRGHSQDRSAGRVNDFLVVAQIALSLVLLAGAGLMLKSVWQLGRVDPGFSADNVLTLQLTIPPGRYDDLAVRDLLRRQVEERVAALPGVDAVGSINYLPLQGSWSGFPYTIDGQEPGDDMMVVPAAVVTPGYFDALRIPLVRGRMLGPEDTGFQDENNVLVVNEAFARQHWPDGDALGGRVLTPGGEDIGTIVGIVRDIRQHNITDPPAPQIFGTATQFGWATAGFMVVRGARAFPSGDEVTSAIHAVESDIAIRNVRTMPDVMAASMDTTRFYARLLLGFAGLGLLLGVVGVYGVISYTVSRRTSELGVRLALGASRRDVLLHVMARAMKPVSAGIVLGLIGALALTRFLANLVVDVRLTDPWVLTGVAAVLATAAAVAALAPAARASRISPTRALQAD